MTATTHRRLISAYAIFGGAAVLALAQPREWKGKFANSSYMHGAMVLPEDQFSAKTTEDAAETVLREVAAKPFATVDIYPAEQFPPVHYMLFSHIGYEWWQRLFPEYPRFSAARVVVIKGNTVFEYSDLKNGVTRKVLQGTDPLVLTTPRGSLTLLSFTFRQTALASPRD
jgi:hypothetical protein